MADYYPLIARAISGLDPSAPGESRRALYERARAALIAQLRGVQPPLSESEITRERLSLEEAVRKVESEAAQRARDATRPGGDATRSGDAARSGDASRAGGDRARAGDSFRANVRPNARPGEPSPPGLPPSASPPRQRPPSPQQPRSERPPLGQEPERQDPRQRNARADATAGTAWGSPTRNSPIETDLGGRIDATIHELGALAYYFLAGGES